MNEICLRIEKSNYKYDPTVEAKLFKTVREAYHYAYSYLRKLSTKKTQGNHSFAQAYLCRIEPFLSDENSKTIYMATECDSGIWIHWYDSDYKRTVMRDGWDPRPESNTKELLRLYKEEHNIHC